MLSGSEINPQRLCPPHSRNLCRTSSKKPKDRRLANPRTKNASRQMVGNFQRPQLNALEEQINTSNQTSAAAEAQFRGARAAIRVARAGLYPPVATGASVTGSAASSNRGATTQAFSPGAVAALQISFSASWEPDLWGQIHKTIEAGVATAQASAADLESVRLLQQTELALDYFQLHGRFRMWKTIQRCCAFSNRKPRSRRERRSRTKEARSKSRSEE